MIRTFLRRPLRILRRTVIALFVIALLSAVCVTLKPPDAAGVTTRAAYWAERETPYHFVLYRLRLESKDVVEGVVADKQSWFVYYRPGAIPVAFQETANGWDTRGEGMDHWVTSPTTLKQTLGDNPAHLVSRLLREPLNPIFTDSTRTRISAFVPCITIDRAGITDFADLLNGQDCELLYTVSSDYHLREFSFTLSDPHEGSQYLGFTLLLTPLDAATPLGTLTSIRYRLKVDR